VVDWDSQDLPAEAVEVVYMGALLLIPVREDIQYVGRHITFPNCSLCARFCVSLRIGGNKRINAEFDGGSAGASRF
jgi:hypothetical protein